jgi:hypothetical protein
VSRVSSLSVGRRAPGFQCPALMAAYSVSRSCAYLGSPGNPWLAVAPQEVA